MLIRHTQNDRYEHIYQEHHALLSGILAGAWAPTRLDPLLVQTIGLHDNPWRHADARPRFDTDRGLPHDFISYPMDDKITFYREGIDALERVDPYVAYMVSRHYTTFAGTRDAATLTEPESERRERLAERLDESLLEEADDALAWIKFFDIFSLHLCLTGPQAAPEGIPRWLKSTEHWATAPDETELELAWKDDETLQIAPWPFDVKAVFFELQVVELAGRFEGADEFDKAWDEASWEVRPLVLVRG